MIDANLIDKANIPNLILALRECGERAFCNDCPIFDTCDGDIDRAMHDAADAIEDLQKGLTTLQKCYEIADTTVDEVLKKLPKRGKWIWDDKRCIYVCSVCGTPKVRENMDRQIIKEQAYCYSCGAKMTEVQE